MQPAHLSRERAQGREIDAGLRRHMNSIYNRMTVGILITALTAWVVGSSPALLQLFLGGPQAYVIIFAPLLIIWFGFNPNTMSSQKLMVVFTLLSFLYGVSFSTIALVFAGADIARAFFVTAGLFASLSILGYSTKVNLQPIGQFCAMAFLGLILVGITAVFFEFSRTVDVLLSVGVVVAVSGMTAWKTQMIKMSYHSSYGEEGLNRMAWAGALSLYMSFIVMFMHILNLMSQQR